LLDFFPVFSRFCFRFFIAAADSTTPYTHTHSTVRVVYIFGTIIDPSRSSGGVAEGSSQWSTTTSGSHPNYSTPPTPHYTTAICSSLFLVLSFFF
jgi:hypothetical protein